MAIHIHNLTKTFGSQEVFRNFSLDLPDAGCVCFFGPSGSGKTTLLHLLAGLLIPDAGSIERPAGCRVSIAFQEDRLLPWISALENVMLVLDSEKTGQKNAAANALGWLETLGLQEAADKLPGSLSGGMRQRVSLARAFAYNGDVLLLDEPFQGIDAHTKENIFSLLDTIKKEKPVILITHYAQEAVRLADCIHIFRSSPAHIVDTITISSEDRSDSNKYARIIKKLTAHELDAGQFWLDTNGN